MGIPFFAIVFIGDIGSAIAASPSSSAAVTALALLYPPGPHGLEAAPCRRVRAPPRGKPFLPAGSERAGQEEPRRL